MLSRHAAGKRILHDRGQRGVGHRVSSRSSSHKAVSQQSESVGVALEVCQIVPETGAYLLLQIASLTLGEVSLYSLLA